MYCMNCGTNLAAGGNFCPRCGHRLTFAHAGLQPSRPVAGQSTEQAQPTPSQGNAARPKGAGAAQAGKQREELADALCRLFTEHLQSRLAMSIAEPYISSQQFFRQQQVQFVHVETALKWINISEMRIGYESCCDFIAQVFIDLYHLPLNNLQSLYPVSEIANHFRSPRQVLVEKNKITAALRQDANLSIHLGELASMHNRLVGMLPGIKRQMEASAKSGPMNLVRIASSSALALVSPITGVAGLLLNSMSNQQRNADMTENSANFADALGAFFTKYYQTVHYFQSTAMEKQTLQMRLALEQTVVEGWMKVLALLHEKRMPSGKTKELFHYVIREMGHILNTE